MQGATLFSDLTTIDDYLDMLLRNARTLAGIDLIVKGNLPGEKAGSLLSSLVDHGLAEAAQGKAPSPAPAAVWRGLEMVQQSGAANLLDRPKVIQIAETPGYTETARRTEGHAGPYAEGIFRGFVVESKGDK